MPEEAISKGLWFLMSESIVWFQKISIPPHGWLMEIPRGLGGGLKARNFRRVWGMPTRGIFHRVVKDAIDRKKHTYVDNFDL